MEKHEGTELRNYLKGKGLEMNRVADKLKMTRQNLNHHLRKQILDDNFKRLVADKLKIDFPLRDGIGSEDAISVSITEPFKFLINRVIKIEAQNEIILQLLALWAARDSEGELSVDDMISKLNRDVQDKIRLLLKKLQ